MTADLQGAGCSRVVRPRHAQEQSLSRWLTLVNNDPGHAASSSVDGDDRAVRAYYGAIADTFLATLAERIRFWERTRESISSDDQSRHEIAQYVERLRRIAALSATGGLAGLNGWGRLLVVAAELLLEPGVADRVRFHFTEMSVDERIDLIWAEEELTYMIERESGRAVEFKPEKAA